MLASIRQLGAGSDGGGGQEAGVRAQGEEPSLQDIPGHRIIGARIVDPGRIVMLNDVNMQLIAQLLFTQHARHKIPPDVLQTPSASDWLPGAVRQTVVNLGWSGTLHVFRQVWHARHSTKKQQPDRSSDVVVYQTYDALLTTPISVDLDQLRADSED